MIKLEIWEDIKDNGYLKIIHTLRLISREFIRLDLFLRTPVGVGLTQGKYIGYSLSSAAPIQ